MLSEIIIIFSALQLPPQYHNLLWVSVAALFVNVCLLPLNTHKKNAMLTMKAVTVELFAVQISQNTLPNSK